MNQISQRNIAQASNFKLRLGIGAKIILPYFLLTLVIAGVGTFVLTNLVTSSFQDRLNNQLIDSGRIVSEGVVQYEEDRLQVLRAVAGTIGVADAVVAEDSEALAGLVPQIIANSNADAVELLNLEGIEVYGWQQPESQQQTPIERSGANLSQIEDVKRVLDGYVDAQGDKRVFLSQTNDGILVFTVGPLKQDDKLVGAVLIGTNLRAMTYDLTLNAVARVTFYDRHGQILETTLGGGQDDLLGAFTESPALYNEVISQLQNIPVIVENPETQTPLRELNILGQSYQLAFGDWRLRSQSFGMFSVALPRNFLITTVINSRNLFLVIFSLATIGVFSGGFLIARRLTRPIHQLVDTATAVTHGNLDQRSGIRNRDEIGRLAIAFDTMTETLSQRNRQLLEKASELEAIVDSIADGVIVLNTDNEIMTLNPAARRLLSDMSHDFLLGPMREISEAFTVGSGETNEVQLSTVLSNREPKRYQVGNRILSANGAHVKTPNGEKIGSVVVLRDVTREVEADNLKDAFITSISHELRTPLTVIKVYADLMKQTANGHLDPQQLNFVKNISKGSQELEHHINQLINISEIQAGTLNLNRVQLNFVELAAEVGEKWRSKLEQKGLSLEIETLEHSLNIDADIAHLSWAVDNLLSNAYNYTPQGGQVSLKTYEHNGTARLDVVDNGIGIAAADQPHLFDRFFRAHHAANYESRGVGLGLFITRSIIELHGGFIFVESESGAGSTFTISIPLVQVSTNEPTKQEGSA
ncbi:MAG: HAMP domain-containing protein [Anaerolineales bacterium]|nr:HAMP domain-containing protein [Anaerolineales bacterium]